MKTTIILLLAIIGVASATFKLRFRYKRCYPPKLPHGTFLKKKYYYVNSVITYKCNPGYYYKGTPKSTCKYYYGRYTWVHYPKCYPVKCKVPTGPSMGSVSPQPGSYVSVGTLIKYSCKDDYVLDGHPTAKCLINGKFSSPVPVCAKQCEVPEEPDDGSVNPKSGTLVKIGTTIKYNCDDGFDLVGSATAKCMANGKFSSNPPTCEEIKCTVPTAPADGSVSPSAGSEVSVGESIHYSCDTNFELDGSPSAKCKDNGQFSSPTPSCQPIKCTVPSAPDDGSVSPKAGSEVLVGKPIYYSCNKGFKLVGSSFAKCKSNGQFSSPRPSCEPLKKPCKRPYTAPGIKISPDYTKHPYPHGTKVKHTCKYGQLEGSYELYCDNGKWIGTPPTCQIYY